MGRIGIEHNGIETVLQAYRHWEQPNYAIYAGKEQRDSYEGGNMEEGESNLSDWLQMIQGNGTTGVYTLRVYPTTETEITTKTPHKGSTTFCLNASDSGRRGEGGVVVVDNTRTMGNAAPNNNIFLQLLESNNKMIGAVTAAMAQQKDDKIDKLITMLLEERNKPPAEEPPHWLEKMALVVAEKPEIIDKIGYLFRPNLYTHEQPINGTKTEPMADKTATAPAAEMTEEQTTELNNRLYTALDNLAARYGLVSVVEMFEKVAAMSDFKINAMKAFL